MSKITIREASRDSDANHDWCKPADPVSASLAGLPETVPTINWSACGRGLACTCGAAVVSHIGCVVSPTLAFVGAVGGLSFATVSVATSAALTGVGAAAWYGLRGRHAGPLETRLTLSGMAAGAAVSLGLHFGGITGGHDHSVEQALEWYRGQPAATQIELKQNAAALGTPFNDYIRRLCTEAAAGPGVKKAAPGLDKL